MEIGAARKLSFWPALLLPALALNFYACGYTEGPETAKDQRTEPLLVENFDNCEFDPQWNASFVRTELYEGHEVPFVSAHGHGCVLHQYIPENMDETTAAQVGLEGREAFLRVAGTPEVDEFYIEWEEFFPEEHDFADCSQKMMRFTFYDGGDSPGSEINLTAQDDNTNIQLFLYHPESENGGPIDLFTNTNLSVPTGRWVRFAVWAKLNTPGEQDGFARAYMDNQEIASLENVSNRGWDTRGWNVMWIGGNHSNNRETTQASSRYIDNIRWYATKPAEQMTAAEAE